MTSTLIGIIFPDRDRAENVFHAMGAMRRRDLYSLDEALLAARSAAGDITVKRLGTPDIQTTSPIQALVRLILAHKGERAVDNRSAMRELQDNGIDHHFVAAVAQALQGESSALFFLVRVDSPADATELSNVLALFRGQIARTTLSERALAYLDARQ